MSSSTSSIPFLWSQETASLPLSSCPRPSSCSQPGGGEAGFPHGDPEFLLLHLLELPRQQANPVIAFERTHPLALEMGRPFVTQGPSASTAISSCFTEAARFLPCWPLALGRPHSWPLACLPLHQPFDIPAGGPEAGVEAERGRQTCWEEEGRAPSASLLSFSSGIFFLSLPLPLPLWL